MKAGINVKNIHQGRRRKRRKKRRREGGRRKISKLVLGKDSYIIHSSRKSEKDEKVEVAN